MADGKPTREDSRHNVAVHFEKRPPKFWPVMHCEIVIYVYCVPWVFAALCEGVLMCGGRG